MIFRSQLEQNVALELSKGEVSFVYEEKSIPFIQPAKKRKYTPDFWLDNGIILEAKGLLSKEDRDKHLWVKQQYPMLDIRFVFQNPMLKISKTSKVSYKDWADKHGFKWCKRGHIPKSWLLPITNNKNSKT